MSFTSDDINYFIYRYLHESGFLHSAFAFANESRVLESTAAAVDIPMGALVNIVQKGVYYAEAEACAMPGTSTVDMNCEKTLIEGLTLIEAASSEIAKNKLKDKFREQQLMKDRELHMNNEKKYVGVKREKFDTKVFLLLNRCFIDLLSIVQCSPPLPFNNDSSSSSAIFSSCSNSNNGVATTSNSSSVVHNHQQLSGGTQGQHHSSYSLQLSSSSATAASHHHARQFYQDTHDRILNGQVGKVKQAAAELRAAQANNGFANGSTIEVDGLAINHINNGGSLTKAQIENQPYEISRDKVRYLKGHESEVFICTWNPKNDLIASGSGDSTARIWNAFGSELPTTATSSIEETSLILKHCIQKDEKTVLPPNKDVTSLDWNCTGDLLATGCYDGYARVWATDGRLRYTLGAHKGPIFALKWNHRGDKILSAGVDKTTIVWDPTKGTQTQVFQCHTSSALDVDWMSEDTFASCSTDQCIHVCRLGSDKPLKTFQGHTNEVNAIKYDSFSHRLASCSDDRTLKIWSMDSDSAIFDIKAHEKEIYTIRWSPVGSLLASASFDHTVRLWDVMKGQCIRTLSKHTEPVYSVGFSPDGKYIASGSFDRAVYIWDVMSGKLIQSYTGSLNDGGIFEVGWNARGDKVGASASDGTVIILDVRHVKSRLI
ncbi:unnamed protein product [Dracunculus medinensis]|uniref:LisH domain-containing protein n=1 Tax=Dracunculus medinensis TaxID=318479 RepID=A0A0N4UDF0_DRAME|nr:unnamed protein product [Dracunculus medinensis]